MDMRRLKVLPDPNHQKVCVMLVYTSDVDDFAPINGIECSPTSDANDLTTSVLFLLDSS